ncbi:MAG: hypothetical protein SFX72_10715 [Isosphaeraceae bacterium]|nr:hypothetical protein [Isosphaeraceae bacterium]
MSTNRHATTGLALAMISLFAAVPARGESVEDPTYRSWAKVVPGTLVTVRTTAETAGGSFLTETHSKLISIDDKRAVVETWTEQKSPHGEITKNAPSEQTIKRMFPLFPGVKKEEIGRPSGAMKKGREKLTIAGREFDAEWYETKGTTEAGPSYTRTWISEDVPGLVLKAETTVPAAKKTTKIELIAIEKP